MFLRKLTVMVVPLLLCLGVCLLSSALSTMGFFLWVIGGCLLGIALALLLPLSGASRMREPFGNLLWVPAVILLLIVAYQYLHSMGRLTLPLLSALATSHGSVIMTECAFIGFMFTTVIRTRTSAL